MWDPHRLKRVVPGEGGAPSYRRGYDPKLLWSGDAEFCFEEIRAARTGFVDTRLHANRLEEQLIARKTEEVMQRDREKLEEEKRRIMERSQLLEAEKQKLMLMENQRRAKEKEELRLIQEERKQLERLREQQEREFRELQEQKRRAELAAAADQQEAKNASSASRKRALASHKTPARGGRVLQERKISTSIANANKKPRMENTAEDKENSNPSTSTRQASSNVKSKGVLRSSSADYMWKEEERAVEQEEDDGGADEDELTRTGPIGGRTPTMTFHTKKALEQVMPLFGEDDLTGKALGSTAGRRNAPTPTMTINSKSMAADVMSFFASPGTGASEPAAAGRPTHQSTERRRQSSMQQTVRRKQDAKLDWDEPLNEDGTTLLEIEQLRATGPEPLSFQIFVDPDLTGPSTPIRPQRLNMDAFRDEQENYQGMASAAESNNDTTFFGIGKQATYDSRPGKQSDDGLRMLDEFDENDVVEEEQEEEGAEDEERNAGQLVDPFHPAQLEKQLAAIFASKEGQALRADRFFFDCRGAVAPGRRILQEKKGRRVSMGGDPTLTLEAVELEVDKRIGDGAFASVHTVAVLEGLPHLNPEEFSYALKVQEPACEWEWYIYQQIKKRLPENMHHNFITFHSIHVYSDKSMILMDYHDQGSLQDVLNVYMKAGKRMDETLVMYYTIEMLKIVEQLHNGGIIHGDLKPDNFLVKNLDREGVKLRHWGSAKAQTSPMNGGWDDKGLVLIDFGRSIDTTLYPAGTRFTGDHVEEFKCLEMREGKPWTYQVDLFGLLGIIHCLLHGSYMEVMQEKEGTGRRSFGSGKRGLSLLTSTNSNAGPGQSKGRTIWRPKQPFKRYWQQELWEALFVDLLNMDFTRDSTAHLRALSHHRQAFESYLLENPTKARLIRTLLAKQNIMVFEKAN
ncbi:Mitotic checkpoint serine/threonine-protein kinase BUB1 [Balamuthia mandrillaris]